MPNLIIDIGNTRIKSALFKDGNVIWEETYSNLDQANLAWNDLDFSECMISSVRWNEDELRRDLDFDFHFLTKSTPLPIQNGYSTPETLGLDRLAAAIGGWQLSNGKATLVVDLGSCMTFELVDDQSTYLGGAISPGLEMRAKAMNQS